VRCALGLAVLSDMEHVALDAVSEYTIWLSMNKFFPVSVSVLNLLTPELYDKFKAIASTATVKDARCPPHTEKQEVTTGCDVHVV